MASRKRVPGAGHTPKGLPQVAVATYKKAHRVGEQVDQLTENVEGIRDMLAHEKAAAKAGEELQAIKNCIPGKARGFFVTSNFHTTRDETISKVIKEIAAEFKYKVPPKQLKSLIALFKRKLTDTRTDFHKRCKDAARGLASTEELAKNLRDTDREIDEELREEHLADQRSHDENGKPLDPLPAHAWVKQVIELTIQEVTVKLPLSEVLGFLGCGFTNESMVQNYLTAKEKGPGSAEAVRRVNFDALGYGFCVRLFDLGLWALGKRDDATAAFVEGLVAKRRNNPIGPRPSKSRNHSATEQARALPLRIISAGPASPPPRVAVEQGPEQDDESESDADAEKNNLQQHRSTSPIANDEDKEEPQKEAQTRESSPAPPGAPPAKPIVTAAEGCFQGLVVEVVSHGKDAKEHAEFRNWLTSAGGATLFDKRLHTAPTVIMPTQLNLLRSKNFVALEKQYPQAFVGTPDWARLCIARNIFVYPLEVIFIPYMDITTWNDSKKRISALKEALGPIVQLMIEDDAIRDEAERFFHGIDIEVHSVLEPLRANIHTVVAGCVPTAKLPKGYAMDVYHLAGPMSFLLGFTESSGSHPLKNFLVDYDDRQVQEWEIDEGADDDDDAVVEARKAMVELDENLAKLGSITIKDFPSYLEQTARVTHFEGKFFYQKHAEDAAPGQLAIVRMAGGAPSFNRVLGTVCEKPYILCVEPDTEGDANLWLNLENAEFASILAYKVKPAVRLTDNILAYCFRHDGKLPHDWRAAVVVLAGPIPGTTNGSDGGRQEKRTHEQMESGEKSVVVKPNRGRGSKRKADNRDDAGNGREDTPDDHEDAESSPEESDRKRRKKNDGEKAPQPKVSSKHGQAGEPKSTKSRGGKGRASANGEPDAEVTTEPPAKRPKKSDEDEKTGGPSPPRRQSTRAKAW